MSRRKDAATRSMERYRKYKLCPVEGCPSAGRPLKKLANHMTSVHPKLSALKRREALKEAKVVPKHLVAAKRLAVTSGKKVAKALTMFR